MNIKKILLATFCAFGPMTGSMLGSEFNVKQASESVEKAQRSQKECENLVGILRFVHNRVQENESFKQFFPGKQLNALEEFLSAGSSKVDYVKAQFKKQDLKGAARSAIRLYDFCSNMVPQEQVASLEEQVATLNGRNAELEKQVKEKEATQRNLILHIKSVENELKSLSKKQGGSSNQQIEKQNSEYRVKIKDMEKHIETLEKRNEALKQKSGFNDLQARIQQLERENEQKLWGRRLAIVSAISGVKESDKFENGEDTYVTLKNINQKDMNGYLIFIEAFDRYVYSLGLQMVKNGLESYFGVNSDDLQCLVNFSKNLRGREFKFTEDEKGVIVKWGDFESLRKIQILMNKCRGTQVEIIDAFLAQFNESVSTPVSTSVSRSQSEASVQATPDSQLEEPQIEEEEEEKSEDQEHEGVNNNEDDDEEDEEEEEDLSIHKPRERGSASQTNSRLSNVSTARTRTNNE